MYYKQFVVLTSILLFLFTYKLDYIWYIRIDIQNEGRVGILMYMMHEYRHVLYACVFDPLVYINKYFQLYKKYTISQNIFTS